MNGITRVVDIPNPEEINSLEFNSGQFDSFKFSTNEDLNRVVKKVRNAQFYHLRKYFKDLLV